MAQTEALKSNEQVLFNKEDLDDIDDVTDLFDGGGDKKPTTAGTEVTRDKNGDTQEESGMDDEQRAYHLNAEQEEDVIDPELVIDTDGENKGIEANQIQEAQKIWGDNRMKASPDTIQKNPALFLQYAISNLNNENASRLNEAEKKEFAKLIATRQTQGLNTPQSSRFAELNNKRKPAVN